MRQIWLASVLLITSQLHAAPTGAGGWIEVDSPFGPAYLHLIGKNFSLKGGFSYGLWPNDECMFCLPPKVVPMTLRGSGEELRFSDSVFFGKHFEYFTGIRGSDLVATAADVEITGPGNYTGNFTFSMGVCGVIDPTPPIELNPCDVHFSLAGAGEYEMVVNLVEDGSLYITRTTYSFPDQLQLRSYGTVPEASTVTTFVSGAGLLLLVRLSQARRSRKAHAARLG